MPDYSPSPPAVPAPYHGSLDYVELERLGLDPDEVLDFSVNSNPFGPSPRVREALARVPLDRYPDRESLALRRALSAQINLPLVQLLAGNGTAELLWLVALAFLGPGDRVLVVGPTFGEYERVSALMGATVERWTAGPEDGFTIDSPDVARQLDRGQPHLAFICNPNNPTGAYLPPEVIGGWAMAHPQTLFVVDEAYLAFAPDGHSVLRMHAANVLVLRSMTKDYALAALRLGYAAGPEPVIAALIQVRPAWNVNALAQAAGVAALLDQEHLSSSLAALAQAKTALEANLIDLGWVVVPSMTHYFLAPVGDGAALRESLLRHGILVRDCASFGLPAYVRIATRRPTDNIRLVETLRALRRGQ